MSPANSYLKKTFLYIISLALLLSLSISSLVYYTWLDLSELAIKQEAHNHLNQGEEKQEIITIPYQQFANADKDEIWQNGELYDIVSYKVEAGIAYVSVIHDTKEESLISKISEHFSSGNEFVANRSTTHMSHTHPHNTNEYKYLATPFRLQLFSTFTAPGTVSPPGLYLPDHCVAINIPPPKQSLS